MIISLIHPSRGRPQKAFETAKKWIENAGCEVEYILSVDNDDPSLKDYFKINCNSDPIPLCTFDVNKKIIKSDNSCVVEATNKASKMTKGDILIYLSDDFDCFPDWGLNVCKEFDGEASPLLIKVDDCLQQFAVAVLTIPIMNRKLYEKLGYFWHPNYRSMFVDEDLYWTCYKLGALKACPHLKFQHLHPANGKEEMDETYRRSNLNWNSGKETFRKRKEAGFPL